jgi:hypothetical protein
MLTRNGSQLRSRPLRGPHRGVAQDCLIGIRGHVGRYQPRRASTASDPSRDKRAPARASGGWVADVGGFGDDFPFLWSAGASAARQRRARRVHHRGPRDGRRVREHAAEALFRKSVRPVRWSHASRTPQSRYHHAAAIAAGARTTRAAAAARAAAWPTRPPRRPARRRERRGRGWRWRRRSRAGRTGRADPRSRPGWRGKSEPAATTAGRVRGSMSARTRRAAISSATTANQGFSSGPSSAATRTGVEVTRRMAPWRCKGQRRTRVR